MESLLPALITCAFAFVSGYLFARGVRPSPTHGAHE